MKLSDQKPLIGGFVCDGFKMPSEDWYLTLNWDLISDCSIPSNNSFMVLKYHLNWVWYPMLNWDLISDG